MRKLFTAVNILFTLLNVGQIFAQNTFPATGNAGIGTTAPTEKLHVAGGNILADGAVYSTNWFRSFGVSGWYNETYRGGLYMSDNEWLRTYNSKNLYCDQIIRADGGFQVAGQQVIDAGGGWHRTYGPTGWYNGTYGGGWHMVDNDWIRSYNSKNVYCDQVIRADGGFQVAGLPVIDAGGGWHRTYGATGWYNGTYGGGMYMEDDVWVRIYNNKAFYSSNTVRTDGELQAGPNGNRFLVDGAGRVKVGNVNMPGGYKLYVEEGILTEKVKVAVKSGANWADHVFKPGYQLKPLHEVEKFINGNGHLPGVPSAGQLVKEGGVDVANMMAKQMEKIEELTLYLIEMKKEIQQLQKENRELKIIQAQKNKE